jgi:predicted heme/steroid binding protein
LENEQVEVNPMWADGRTQTMYSRKDLNQLISKVSSKQKMSFVSKIR